MNKDIRLHTDFIHSRKRKKLQQELGCDGLLKGWYKILTFIEGKWYINRVVAKSTMEFDISKTQRCPKDTSYLFCKNTLPYLYDTARVSSGFVPPVAFVAGLSSLIHGPFLFLAKQTCLFRNTHKGNYHV